MTDYGPMSPSMWEALEALPVQSGPTWRGWCRPVGSPNVVTLQALKARGLASHDPDERRWTRTPAGDGMLRDGAPVGGQA